MKKFIFQKGHIRRIKCNYVNSKHKSLKGKCWEKSLRRAQGSRSILMQNYGLRFVKQKTQLSVAASDMGNESTLPFLPF